MNMAFIADILGAVVCPIILAVVGGISGIRGETSVLKYYIPAAAAVGAVGLARGIIFVAASGFESFSQATAVFAGAMKYLLVSFLLLSIWFIIFEISRYIMSKGTKYNKVKKSAAKKR